MSDFPVIMPVYNRAPLWFEKGEGAYLYDDKGDKYLDFVAGVAVVGLGHCNPRITEVLKKQAETLWTVSNVFHTKVAETLAQKLVDNTFADTVFFQNSGVEAWECCVKVIRKYFSSVGKPEKQRIIGFKGCFHGRSMTAIAASKTEKMVGGFGNLIDCFDLAEWGDIGSIKNLITNKTAAIMIEPVLGEGGAKRPPEGFLKELRKLCDENDLLLFFDEIQCGMGRTGKLFAHEWDGVVPDVMAVAKALGNGFPIGACLATAKAAQGMTKGTHGSTYGGNPLATSVGLAVLNVMTEPGFMQKVCNTSEKFSIMLETVVKENPSVFSSVRGRGLLRGIECIVPNSEVAAALRNEKLLSIEAGENVIRLLPPLTIEQYHIEEAYDKISKAVKRM
ncbi:MAG: aspartate aminotransferase family protein [Alphaproteobacteria bacterium]|nr:aspartate aminotransferase family protein [Alphaproteobacteria bacterium]MCL2505223.1 aspartate aminotransferase family protein [Alphaproteobacteria bacterium]